VEVSVPAPQPLQPNRILMAHLLGAKHKLFPEITGNSNPPFGQTHSRNPTHVGGSDA